ncbi:YbaK/EbsC family protein [Ktedonosporobacter rubrisoli]|uniref:YbaK/EbsC family protein n=1 Tax=Ktedonosporobacter rubrisoli TaxID=2509675 RepID=A0A4P6JI24_KTERU|nr:YbaK/EbsC family protein [Ktedonosporobacter rubrisoli]QBD74698.1 YbaK/EbsC family protein [Ktedonosporobacter rubrisoli]
MQCQEKLERYLRQEKVGYQIQHHPTAFTAQQIAECEHISGKKVVKSVVVMADHKMALLALPASLRVDLEKVRSLLGARDVRLALEGEFESAFPDCDVGAMPPFGNLYNLPTYVEQSLTRQETIVFPIGSRTETMSMHYADYERLVQPNVIEFALKPSMV